MRKLIIILLIIIIVLSIRFGYFSKEYKRVCIGDNCFLAEIADSAGEREKGLMGREQMEEDEGMLFVFDKKAIYPFWMKNTLIPLDIIWINDNLVVHIEKNALPCKKDEECVSYTPLQEADYVLEINGNKADELGIEAGDEVRIT